MKFKDTKYGDLSISNSSKIKDINVENKRLTSLEGSPEIVYGRFSCRYNKLTSLEGCPKEVIGSFNCGNNDLTSLNHCPKKIGKTFVCRGLKNIKNIKEEIIKHNVVAKQYFTDEGNFLYKDLEDYKKNLIKKNQEIVKNNIFNEKDYGLSI